MGEGGGVNLFDKEFKLKKNGGRAGEGRLSHFFFFFFFLDKLARGRGEGAGGRGGGGGEWGLGSRGGG